MLNIRDIFSYKIVFKLHVRCGSSTLSTKNAKTSFLYSTDKQAPNHIDWEFAFTRISTKSNTAYKKEFDPQIIFTCKIKKAKPNMLHKITYGLTIERI